MSVKDLKPENLAIDNFQHYFNYFYNQSFLWLMSDITKDYLITPHNKAKNKKELLISYWLILKLRLYIQQLVIQWVFPPNNINILMKERIIGLLDSVSYDIVITYNNVPIIVIDTYYFMSNVSRNFQRIFKNIVFNANNVNQHDWLEYIPFILINEESPSFVSDDSKELEKMEEFNLVQLAKLYNLSICKHNKIDMFALILAPYIDVDNSKKGNNIKVKVPKFSTTDFFLTQAIRDGYVAQDIDNIRKKIVISSTEEFIKMILAKIATRMKGANY